MPDHAPTPRGVLARVRTAASRWQTAIVVTANVLVCEIGARVGLPGVNGARVQQFLAHASLGLIDFFNVLVGGGVARAAVLALGIVPYVQARVYVAIARALFPAVRRATDEAAPRRTLVRMITLGAALVQSAGFAQFLQRIPGAVATPGVGFVVQTVALLTGSAVLVGWLAERMTDRFSERAAEPALDSANESRSLSASTSASAHIPVTTPIDTVTPRR